MSTDGGWIKIYRDITNHWIWKDPEQLRAWLDLIMLVNHRPGKIKIDNRIISVKVGQRWTSVGFLAERWGWTRNRVKRFLNLLEADGMIKQKSTHRGHLISLVNYAVYQGFESARRATDEATDEATDGHQSKQHSEQQSKQPTDIRRSTNKNNIKNDKNDIRMIKNEKKGAACGSGRWRVLEERQG